MPPKIEKGRWDGEYFDAHGYRGKLRLDLAESDDPTQITGEAELTLRAEDAPERFRGRIEGWAEDDDDDPPVKGAAGQKGGGKGKGRARLRLKLGEKDGGEIEYTARIRPAGSHARQVMFGEVQAAPQANFGGGVWIAWKYDRPDPEG